MKRTSCRVRLNPLVSAIFLALAIAGCSHKKGPVASQTLFVAVPARHAIELFPANSRGKAAPAQTILEAPSDRPIDIGLDRVAHLLVANANGNVRRFWARGPYKYYYERSMSGPDTNFTNMTSIAVGQTGAFYIARTSSGPTNPASVQWYNAELHGDISPGRVLSGPQTEISDPQGIALDGSGRLYVADPKANKILIFSQDANGDQPPVATLTGLRSPIKVAVDPELDVYVVNKADDSISVFESSGPQSWTLAATIHSSAIKDPTGIAVDAIGEIAVATPKAIVFFAPDANGTVAPVRELSSASIANPAGIFIQ